MSPRHRVSILKLGELSDLFSLFVAQRWTHFLSTVRRYSRCFSTFSKFDQPEFKTLKWQLNNFSLERNLFPFWMFFVVLKLVFDKDKTCLAWVSGCTLYIRLSVDLVYEKIIMSLLPRYRNLSRVIVDIPKNMYACFLFKMSPREGLIPFRQLLNFRVYLMDCVLLSNTRKVRFIAIMLQNFVWEVSGSIPDLVNFF